MSTEEPEDIAQPHLGGLLEKLSPAGGLAAQQSLAALQERLFGNKPAQVQIGKRYLLDDKIASGSGGAVYAGRDIKRDRKVAIKLLHPGQEVTGGKGRARLLREAQSLAKLSHPNIVRVYDVGTYDPAELWVGEGPRMVGDAQGVFVVMEFVEGANLGRWLNRAPRTWREIRDVFIAAGRGLAAAHAATIVHRDFKPANVLVGRDGRVLVADFGLARATGPMSPDPVSPLGEALAEQVVGLGAGPMDLSLTASGAYVGTPAYVAPEQYKGGRPDARSDQYSFCVALYEGFFGSSPFVSGSEVEIRRAKENGWFLTPPRDAKVPARFVPVLHRGMAPNPEDRYGSMTELLAELGRPTRRTRSVLLGSIALAAVGAAGWWIWTTASPDPCVEAMAPAHRRWNDDARETLRKRIAAAEVGWAAEVADRIEPRIDAWVSTWTKQVTAACREPDPRRLACLGTRFHGVEALMAGLLDPTPARLVDATEAVEALPPLGPCSTEALSEYGPPAGDIGRTLVAASVQARLGTHGDALSELDAFLARADIDADPTLRAQLLLTKGRLLAADGNAEAEATLSDALWAAAALDDEAAQAMAGLELLVLTVPDPARRDDARMFARHLRDVRPDPRLPTTFHGESLLLRARLARALDENAEARRLLDEAAISLEGIDPPPTILVDVYLAQGLGARASKLAEQLYGPTHPKAAKLAF